MNVGELVIQISANVARLQTDMAASQRVVSGAMRGIQSSVDAARSALIALTGITGIGAFVHIVNGAIEAKAKLYDMSLQTGINVEALGGLAKVARLSSTDIETVAGASNKLSKALATNNEDSKGAAQGIRALGLDYATFKAMGADEQLVAVAKAMEGFADGTGKSATAMLLFGKTGAQLLPFLKELHERGVMASKQTTESAKAAKELKDSIELLKGVGEGWANAIATAIIPRMAAYLKQMEEAKTWNDRLAISFKNMGENLGFNPVSKAQSKLVGLSNQIAKTVSEIEDMRAGKDELPFTEQRITGLEKKLDDLRAKAAKARDELLALVNGPGTRTAGEFQRGDKDRTPVKRPDLNVVDPAAVDQALKQAEKIAKLQIDAEEQAAKDAAEAWDVWGRYRLAASDERTKAEMDQWKQVFDFIDQQTDEEEERMRTAANSRVIDGSAMAGAKLAVAEYLRFVEAVGPSTERAVGRSLDMLEDSLVNFAMTGRLNVHSLINYMISEFARLSIIKPLLAGLFGGGLGGVFGSLLGGGSAPTGVGAIDPNGFFLAGGGPAKSGMPYVVGEQGPELFVPNSSGTVVPNSAAGGSRITVNQTINNKIDSRSDAGWIASNVQMAIASSQKAMLEELRAQGVLQ